MVNFRLGNSSAKTRAIEVEEEEEEEETKKKKKKKRRRREEKEIYENGLYLCYVNIIYVNNSIYMRLVSICHNARFNRLS